MLPLLKTPACSFNSLNGAFRALLFAVVSMGVAVSGRAVDILSPNRALRATITTDASGRLMQSLTAQTIPVLLPSPLGIIVDGDDLGTAARMGTPVQRIINETYPVLGVHAVAVNRCRDYSIPVTGGTGKVSWTLEVRVFDDGLACRYRVPAGSGERTINGETTAWAFPAGGTLGYQNSRSRDYEQQFTTIPADSLPQDQSIMADSTLKLPGGLGYVMATEANLIGYSDMILQPDGPGRFRAMFPYDGNGWKQTGEIVSPWRVTLYAPNLNVLVNTDILRNLCPPPAPALAKASWIFPGRANWHWMVSGRPKLEDQRKWVDWTCDLGWEYYLIDDGWVTWADAGKDQWACMKDVVDYAKTKDVRIWAWVHTKEVTDPAARLAYFKKAKDTGLVGLKIDFMGPPSAQWVKWYDETLRDAAAAHLMIDFHGCVKPTGRERTWPHELTREGIAGRENGKMPAVHDSTLPFTRYVQGHADYTPTDWRGEKLRGNSYAHELAQAIVYTSPLLCYSGAPVSYLQNEAISVLKAIPATWDETVVLPGSEMGEVAAFARRKGNAWFIGVINGGTARSLDIPLKFLGGGTWKIDQFADSPMKTDAWTRKTASVRPAETFAVDLRADGGFVARITQ